MKYAFRAILVLLVAGALMAGCATSAPTTATAPAAKAAFPKFHTIVDTAFVMQNVTVPMAPGVMLIDSRPTRAKYDKGHIPMAVSIPFSRFDKMTDKLPADKSTLLVFYCGGFKCPLSHKSAKKALGLGYTNVKVFSAGYPAWKKVAGTPTAIKGGQEEGSIDIALFKKLITETPGRITLIDVRDPAEFALGHFKTAKNIPVDVLEAQAKKLNDDKPIVFVCSTGARSGESFYMLQDIRPELKKVHYLDAEVTFTKDGTYKISRPAS